MCGNARKVIAYCGGSDGREITTTQVTVAIIRDSCWKIAFIVLIVLHATPSSDNT